MDYKETLDYLFAKLPMFSRIGPAAFKKDLTNTITLCGELGNPQDQFKSVHIAGTNGKGSVSHMLASIFQSAGYKTGLYTSPHLKDFRERIKINGKLITKEQVVAFVERMRTVTEAIEPSFFELTVAMAFDYFANEAVDIAIIETGLGGRLDSTNVIVPELSVITNIGWDHMNMLGDSLEQIAFEKAGIIKEGIPVVVGTTSPETLAVFEKTAVSRNAPLFISNHVRQVSDWHWEKHQLVVEVSEAHHTDHKIYRLDLPGLYQTKNLLTVLESCSVLKTRGWNIPEEAIIDGLLHTKKQTGLHGRWEILREHPLVVLDVAHNKDGIEQLLQQVEITDHSDLHIIIGFVKDKDTEGLLSLLPKHAKYYFTEAHIPRALPANELKQQAEFAGLIGSVHDDVNKALHAAMVNAAKQDMILVCGSIFLVGEVSLSAVKDISNSVKLEGISELLESSTFFA